VRYLNPEKTEPLYTEIQRFTKEARTTSKNLSELKDLLRPSRTKAREDTEDIDGISNTILASQRYRQQSSAAPFCRSSPPIRNSRHHFASQTGTQSHMPYERSISQCMIHVPNMRHHAPTPGIPEPDNDADVIMTSLLSIPVQASHPAVPQ